MTLREQAVELFEKTNDVFKVALFLNKNGISNYFDAESLAETIAEESEN